MKSIVDFRPFGHGSSQPFSKSIFAPFFCLILLKKTTFLLLCICKEEKVNKIRHLFLLNSVKKVVSLKENRID